MQQSLLTGGSATTVLIYPGSMKEYKNQASPQSVRISYENITTIKIKKTKGAGGVLKGILIGGGIGLSPAFFGEGGAYAAIIAFPVGVILGAIIGATSKKKYEINGELNSFQKFIHKFIK